MVKKMTDDEIDSRTKDNSYITLNKATIKKVIKQLPAATQVKCFGDKKTISPLDKFESAYLLSQIPDLKAIDDRPISQIPLEEKRQIIKNAYEGNEEFKKIVDDEKLGTRAELLADKEVPGDFSPSNLWEILDEMIADLDLAKTKE